MWLDEWITEYGSYVQRKYRENTLLLSKVQISFSKGLYQDVIQEYNEIVINNDYYRLRVRLILLCCYSVMYEEDLQLFEFQIRNFNKLLQRREVFSSSITEAARNVSDLLISVAKLKDIKRVSTSEKKGLLDLVESHDNIFHKSWIINRINNLS